MSALQFSPFCQQRCVSLVLQGLDTKACRVHNHVVLALLTVHPVINVCKIRPFACVHSLLENNRLAYAIAGYSLCFKLVSKKWPISLKSINWMGQHRSKWKSELKLVT